MPDLLAAMLLADSFFLGWNIGTAFYQKWLFKNNKPFNHLIWFIIYSVLVVASYFIWKNPWISINAALIRVVVFDPFLNLIRGHSFWYTNATETDGNDSKTDDFKEENPVLAKGFYFLAIALLIVIHLIIIKSIYAG